ncbi:MAG: hypothetical protein R3B84_09420 [Zavarzinella sp.]
MNHIDFHHIQSRLYDLAVELAAGCDQEFDATYDELERQFDEIRFSLQHAE